MVAVTVMGVMKVPIDKIIDVVTVRHRLMTASGSMLVACVVTCARMGGRTVGRIGGVHFQLVLVDVVPMRMVQVTVVKIVNMPIVLDGRMATTIPVRVIVIRVCIACVSH
jgi:hypothetical protein